MNTKRLIVIGLVVLCVAAGVAVPAFSQTTPPRSSVLVLPRSPFRFSEREAGSGTRPSERGSGDRGWQAIPPPRYQVISDMLDMQQRIEALERDNAELREDIKATRDQVGALQLLRAYDIGFNQRTRAEDQKRITALEWVVSGQSWPSCLK